MSDITKCYGIGCPIKESCHRFTDDPDGYQSYFVEIPGKWDWERDTNGDEIWDRKVFRCDMFWGKNQEEILKQLNYIVRNAKD